MQAHMQSNDNVMSEEQLWNQIEDYAILGKNIQFTEITVTSSERLILEGPPSFSRKER